MRSKPWKMHHDFCAAPAYGANLQCDYIYFKPKEIAWNGVSRGPHKGSLSEPKFVQSGLSLKYPEISFGWAVSNRDTVECWHEKLCWVKYSPSLKGFLQCCIITRTDLLVANQFFAHQGKHLYFLKELQNTHCLVKRRKCKRLKQWEKIDKEYNLM